jgi:hypothetical protein
MSQDNEYTSIRIKKELLQEFQSHAKKYYTYGLPTYKILHLMKEDSRKYQEGLLRDSNGKFKQKEK